MPDTLRKLEVPLADPWHSIPVDDAPPAPPALRRHGVELLPKWQAECGDGAARVTIYAVHSDASTLEQLRSALREHHMAEDRSDCGDLLIWAAKGLGGYVYSALRTPEQSKQPLLWIAYVTEASAEQRIPEIEAAIDRTRWKLLF